MKPSMVIHAAVTNTYKPPLLQHTTLQGSLGGRWSQCCELLSLLAKWCRASCG